MAAITSAAAGNASAAGTWTGGVVPGTTFAAIQRTTNASGYAVGATLNGHRAVAYGSDGRLVHADAGELDHVFAFAGVVLSLGEGE